MPTDNALIQAAIARAKLAKASEQAQREREKKALEFQVPEKQWPDEVKNQRNGATINGVVVNARPMLSIPKIDQPIQLILNQEKAAHLGVQIHPLSEEATDDTAEVMQGLYRAIERDSRANIARSWAFERAVKAGRGAYRILTDYAEDGGDPADQRILFKRLLRQEDVAFDPSAQEPDWSDGLWAQVWSWYDAARYEREFGDEYPLAVESDDAFAALVSEEPDWFREIDGVDGLKKPGIRVLEDFTVEITTRTRCAYDTGQGVVWVWKDEAGDQFSGQKPIKERDIPQRTVMWRKMTAKDILDEQELDGQYIPLVPVIGRELVPFDGERRWVGMYEPAMDGQRLFNYAASNAVEIAALEPKAPFVMVEGQDSGFEPEWDAVNTRNLTRLHYRNVNLMGQPAPAPQRMQIDAGRLGPSMMLLQEANSFIQSTTATFDASLGQRNPRSQSGRAELALQQQTDQATSDYLDNLAQISMMYEAKVVLDLMGKVYDRPGRLARILGTDDEMQTVMLNAPFVMKQGRPQPPNPLQRLAGKAKRHDLSKGIYGVSVTVGKAYNTRLEEGADEIGQILTSHPELVPLIGPEYFNYRDFPGHDRISEILKKFRAMKFPGLDVPDQGQDADPATLQSQLQAAQQHIQMLTQQLQQAGQMIEGKKVEQDGKLQQTALTQGAALEKARMDNETKLAVAELGAKVDRMTLFLEERARLGTQQHEVGMALVGREAARQQGQQDQDAALEQGEQTHSQTLAQQQQAAALAPEPAGEA